MTADRQPGKPADGPRPPAGGSGQPQRDPGLQPERTRLAWRRTALALTVIMILTVRLALTADPPPGDALGALVAGVAVLGWGATLAVCWRRATGAGPARTDGRSLPLVALATAGYALLGTVLATRGLW
ncbi:DUF202 domain-containing protein [Micromonospora phytophila]|uniref:DUF202 domain-containing protein n=1 Tax=Micromonospora phytophila TaxID=709888 RepID=UPI002030BE8C|nr:DUF202 domain-containing protein [Micromonospora phytophila]MCM0675395.1 DUF202 domain-containing protein [Micromonospora phytophila]